jgi:hypothetical protein
MMLDETEIRFCAFAAFAALGNEALISIEVKGSGRRNGRPIADHRGQDARVIDAQRL